MSGPRTGPQPVTTPGGPGVQNLERIQRYGKYFLLRKLAEGGMAEIFLAKQSGAEGFERNVVVKRMLKHLSDEPSFVEMFLDEARLAARLAHQNIVQIHDLGLAEGCYFICMEYLAGEDLSTILRAAGRQRQYVPLQVVLRVIAEAAYGLHYAHEFADENGAPMNVVHRDISPSNIYVTFQGQVKVLDFGIARAESRTTKTTAGVVKGKYMYMPPEQAKGAGVDRRADVYALGVSLFEALTNVRPFARDHDLAILNAVLHGEFSPPRHYRPDLPQDLEALVLKAMAHRPEDRFQTAQAFAVALDSYMASRTSGSGGSQTQAYLRTLFGEERITQKTRVPSLDSLLKSGMTVSGFTDPEMKTVNVPQEERTSQLAPPPAAPAPARGAPGRHAVMAGLALLAVLGTGAAAWSFFLRADPTPAPEPVAQVQPAAPPPAPAPEPVKPQVEPPEPADDAAVEPAAGAPTQGTKPAVVRRTPVKLTAAEIQKVIARGSAPITRCFESNKEELPADQGQVTVQFTILDTGKVTDPQVKGALAGTKTAACVQQRVAALKFPAHTDKQVTLGVPFGYRVTR
jgi:serine/threonine protein kinase